MSILFNIFCTGIFVIDNIRKFILLLFPHRYQQQYEVNLRQQIFAAISVFIRYYSIFATKIRNF